MRSRLLAGLRVLERSAALSNQLAIAAMTGLVLLQVVLRYVFRAPLPWVEEVTIFLMIWMTFVGAGVALRSGSHIAMTLLRDRLGPRVATALAMVSHAVILAFLLLLAWQGWLLVGTAEGQRSPALGIPMAWPYLTMPVGAAFMASQVVAALLEWRHADRPTEGI